MKEFKLTRKDLPPNPRGGYRSQGVQWTDSNEG